jgi:hypothetical protein
VRKSTWKVKGGEDGGGWQAARDGSARVRRPPGPSLLVDARLRGRGCVGDGSGRDEVGGGIGGGRDDARESMWCGSESGSRERLVMLRREPIALFFCRR